MTRRTPAALAEAERTTRAGLSCLPLDMLARTIADLEAALWGENPQPRTIDQRKTMETLLGLLQDAESLAKQQAMMRTLAEAMASIDVTEQVRR